MSGLPDLWERRADALALLRRAPAALFADIDGTIAPIAPEPSAAAVLPEARDALAALAGRVTSSSSPDGAPRTPARWSGWTAPSTPAITARSGS